MNLASVDLNRLLVLHAVLEERSVTRAARRLHVTPPAISNALALLRETFGDPLVVRSGRGLALTPRAEALAPQLAEAVAAVTRVVEAQAAFDPATSTRTFALACSDAQQMWEVPRVAAAFSQKLPRASLRIVSVEQLEAAGGLAAADVDVAIAPAHGPSEAPGQGLRASDLHREEGVFVARKGHPRVHGKITRELFGELRHIDILLALGRGGIGHRAVEGFLASHGLRRDIAVTVPSFTAAAAIAAQTDWIAGMPRRVAEMFVQHLPLAIAALPVPVMAFQMRLVWHDRTHVDPGARFFRSLVMSAVRAGTRVSARRGRAASAVRESR